MLSQLNIALRPFHKEKPWRNAVMVFLLTTLFYFIGAMFRLVEELSLFWPLNAVMAGVFARYTWLNRVHNYALCYVAMLVYDALTTTWGVTSLVINLSNMVFIITVAQLIVRDKRRPERRALPINALRIFNYCLLGALGCALVGAFASVGIDNLTFWPLFADWFSEQFSTGVLILPCVLTLAWPRRVTPFRVEPLLPTAALLISLTASVVIGGAGSLLFPLPALIWCAVRYSLLTTALLTFLTGALEIIMVANGTINIFVASPVQMPRMFSARLGIATMAICPIIVCVSVNAINALMKQVSLRADFDFLTRVYSRSGLYETLGRERNSETRHLTVMLLDIDYFKTINDSFGHECGDRVLTAFAQKIQQVVGDSGMVARMGGEEFAVVATTQDPHQGFMLAESIRRAVEAYPFHWQQQTLFLTVSIGLSSGTAQSWELTERFNKLLAEADEYLYQSKKAGRNRTSSREYQEPVEAVATDAGQQSV
ncbi:diguanylate cyclase [Pseudescherichia vulneris]|uniref:GGDEF domain-containing protein n=1 Tax=Pseudescherichia vulneris TaxID=566 RepID=UPI00227AECE6|nr:sensor domain-containing diguanylate cyclase [Pseudescherichia vulneris]WAH52986.1 diguanylate cyclase [Pseudescherichia vulneris]